MIVALIPPPCKTMVSSHTALDRGFLQVRPVFPLAISQWTHFGSGFAAATLRPDELQV